MGCEGGCRAINDHAGAAARIAQGREWFAKHDRDPKNVLREKELTSEQEHWLYHKFRAIRWPFLCRFSLPDPRSAPFDKLTDAVAVEFGQPSVKEAIVRAVAENKALALINKWIRAGVIWGGVARLLLTRFRTEHKIVAAPHLPPLSFAPTTRRVARSADIERVTLLGDHKTYLERALHTTVAGFVARVMDKRGVSFRFIDRMERLSGCVIGEKQVRLVFPSDLITMMIRSAATQTIRMARNALTMSGGGLYSGIDAIYYDEADWKTTNTMLAELDKLNLVRARPQKMTKKELHVVAKRQAKEDHSRMVSDFLASMTGANKRARVVDSLAGEAAAAAAPVCAKRGWINPEAIRGLMADGFPRSKLILNLLSMMSPDDMLVANTLGWHGFLASSEVFDNVLECVKDIDPEVHKVVSETSYETTGLLTIVTIEYLDQFFGEFCRLAEIAPGEIVTNCSAATWAKAVTVVL